MGGRNKNIPKCKLFFSSFNTQIISHQSWIQNQNPYVAYHPMPDLAPLHLSNFIPCFFPLTSPFQYTGLLPVS